MSLRHFETQRAAIAAALALAAIGGGCTETDMNRKHAVATYNTQVMAWKRQGVKEEQIPTFDEWMWGGIRQPKNTTPAAAERGEGGGGGGGGEGGH